MTDIAGLRLSDDVAFARHLVEDPGVASCPGRRSTRARARPPKVRFAFPKKAATLARPSAGSRRSRLADRSGHNAPEGLSGVMSGPWSPGDNGRAYSGPQVMSPQDHLDGDPSETGPDRMGRADLKIAPRVRRLRRFWRTVPSAPRCKMCTSPFGPPGGSITAAHRQGAMAWQSEVLRRLLQGPLSQSHRRGDRMHPALRRYPWLNCPGRDHARLRLPRTARSVLRDSRRKC